RCPTGPGEQLTHQSGEPEVRLYHCGTKLSRERVVAPSVGGAVGAEPGHDQVDAVGREAVMCAQMGSDLLDKFPDMVGHRPASATHQVELVVGMGDLPSGR